jgi:transaldolase
MQLFIDTADTGQIREAYSWGLVDGVTTNPSHIAATGRPFEDVLAEIFAIVDGPISVESVSQEASAIVREGQAIAAFHSNAVVKVPVSIEGLKAVRRLASEGIRTNVTAVFTPVQAFLAAKAGATYVSPFIHRRDLEGDDGAQVVRDIRVVFDRYGYPTRILAASVRTARQVLESLKAGADVATMPFDVLQSLYRHSLTDAVLEQFNRDWARVPPTKLFSTAAATR